jgi:hypothetical protein
MRLRRSHRGESSTERPTLLKAVPDDVSPKEWSVASGRSHSTYASSSQADSALQGTPFADPTIFSDESQAGSSVPLQRQISGHLDTIPTDTASWDCTFTELLAENEESTWERVCPPASLEDIFDFSAYSTIGPQPISHVDRPKPSPITGDVDTEMVDKIVEPGEDTRPNKAKRNHGKSKA